MTHRLDIRKLDRAVVFELHGVVDAAALASVRAALDFARANGATVRLVLRAGAEVERACLAELGALGIEVVAESAYLAAWIAGEASR